MTQPHALEVGQCAVVKVGADRLRRGGHRVVTGLHVLEPRRHAHGLITVAMNLHNALHEPAFLQLHHRENVAVGKSLAETRHTREEGEFTPGVLPPGELKGLIENLRVHRRQLPVARTLTERCGRTGVADVSGDEGVQIVTDGVGEVVSRGHDRVPELQSGRASLKDLCWAAERLDGAGSAVCRETRRE